MDDLFDSLPQSKGVTVDDVMITAAAMLAVYIREPEFVGQTKDRLATVEASRIVEKAVQDKFEHWLTSNQWLQNRSSIVEVTALDI